MWQKQVHVSNLAARQVYNGMSALVLELASRQWRG
jgi:hypothetical protein